VAEVGECSLCSLPVGEAVTADDVDGQFCCRGCLAVARRVDEDEGVTDVEDGPDTADGDRAYLAVEGMHCVACESYLEAVATDQPGVLAADAAYTADAMRVTYDPDRVDPDRLPAAVEGAGYRVDLAADPDGAPGTVGGDPRAGTTPRLLVGGFFGMMAMLWYVLFLYPAHLGVPADRLLVDLTDTAGAYLLGNVWLAATVVLGYTGFPLLRGALVSLRVGRPNMDLLVATAATTAYLYSTLAVLAGRTEVYFDVTVVVVLAVTLGNHFETRTKRRAAGRLADLTAERVETARRLVVGLDEAAPPGEHRTETVPVEALSAGELVRVDAGERVPVDGVVREGRAAIDRSLVTGEAAPVPVEPGSEVVGGAVATDGALVVAVGEDATSTLDRLVGVLWETGTARSSAGRLADRLAGAFVPLAVAVALSAGVAHLLSGAAPTDALLTGLAVLVVSCPCALGVATPLATAAGVRAALDHGVAVTDPSVVESLPAADVLAVDKTGTLTTGEFAVEAVETVADVDPDRLLARAAAVEARADHPVSTAVVDAATDLPTPAVDSFERHPGRGVSGVVDGDRVVAGRPALFEELGLAVPDDLTARHERARESGQTATLVGWGGRARGAVVAVDRPREGWSESLSALGADDREVVVLTGDRAAAAERYREHPAVADVFAGLPPEGKAETVARLREGGDRTVAMVGDGVNDAPAMAAADAAVAVARGAGLAADAADAVVTTDRFRTVADLDGVLRATRRRVRTNLGWALCYNAVALPLAALGAITPLSAAVAMAGSSLLVVANSARSLSPAGSAVATPDTGAPRGPTDGRAVADGGTGRDGPNGGVDR
jgi:Cu2+-exporting ATPase